MSVAYIDASAFVKLFKPEPETVALKATIDEHRDTISSELLVVEALCTAQRTGIPRAAQLAGELLELMGLIEFGAKIRRAAATTSFRPALRALDAIHLASALSARDRIDVFLAYDSELCAAAAASGLRVESPA